jgi:hypothetical protein
MAQKMKMKKVNEREEGPNLPPMKETDIKKL